MENERLELERLLMDSHRHGRWYIENFDYSNGIMSLPTTFDLKQAIKIQDSINFFFDVTVRNAAEFADEYFKRKMKITGKVK